MLYFSLFNTRNADGNKFVNYMIFGIGYSIGQFGSGILIQKIKDKFVYASSLITILFFT